MLELIDLELLRVVGGEQLKCFDISGNCIRKSPEAKLLNVGVYRELCCNFFGGHYWTLEGGNINYCLGSKEGSSGNSTDNANSSNSADGVLIELSSSSS